MSSKETIAIDLHDFSSCTKEESRKLTEPPPSPKLGASPRMGARNAHRKIVPAVPPTLACASRRYEGEDVEQVRHLVLHRGARETNALVHMFHHLRDAVLPSMSMSKAIPREQHHIMLRKT